MKDFMPLNVAILTVSDTRTTENDGSGDYLEVALTNAGHRCAERRIVADDVYRIRADVSCWIADPAINVIITTGGTGFTGRDTTPDALEPLFDQPIPGFGELFRQLSRKEVGSSTLQSRCVAGFVNHTLIFALPGSTNACRTGWEQILIEQLDSRHQPCNFANLVNGGSGHHG
ncbi:molybdenum cofactor biosynthesis protein B [Larsenimonas rhizosphaerae]|uniref:Molybdenum cofactor biosynthesis protein B n=1 Tax=Larsenimonas rhizosphaerae TaxID=2944682 RepID=A0AA41ZF13_9GAMM|nr:molybdenum cofactor biosynthesis protein B [Larsenimonas rhizosphaerae]MCX2523345.1 molybdenum cofactor biosynthesis protein B [Larsenimonas rhizosphaerae]